VVYAAYDTQEDAQVALKWLRNSTAATIARFKREFRALADLAHPNLVTFRELLTVGGEWFFTMDLVEGIDLLHWVRPASPPVALQAASTAEDDDVAMGSGSTVAVEQPRSSMLPRSPPLVTGDQHVLEGHRPLSVADLPRLKATLLQLAAGLTALHEGGMLHRDVKPSNVLVTRDGRVVLLDFGLVTELGEGGVAESMTGQIVGTPGYMSPEQAAGRALTQASDWYAVGVTLYHALTGKLPFDGDPSSILFRKQLMDPAAPSDHVRGVPRALGDLCMDLLARSPERRPSGAAFVERLHAALPATATPALESGTTRAAVDFLGRETHLWALDEALEEAERNKTVIALVHGQSGMGKTALVRHFLANVRRDRPEVVVLEGRCYERESVPYKAIDSLVDALCRYLQRLPEVEVARLLPRDLGALARLFPVFLQFEASVTKRPRTRADLVQERRRAFAALRELLARVADRSTLVLFIDDLQWGDGDSEPLLVSLLRPPESPALLLLAAYRSEDAASPVVRALVRLGASEPALELCEIPVGELPPEAATELATSLLDGRGGSHLAQNLAKESFGSPLFLRQLAALGRGENIGLAEVIQARVAELPVEARRFLEVLAVSGRPLPLTSVARASGIEHDAQSMLSRLRSECLVRTRGTEARDEVEVYHDRLREVIVASLDGDDLRERHHRLARALASAGDADAEALATHFRAAGDRDRAAEYAKQASDRAAGALAFDRAASMYEMAIELSSTLGRSAPDLTLKLAEALASAGRGQEASERFLEAARTAVPVEALELRRRAAEQLLLSGHIEEGLAVVDRILTAMKMWAPRTRFASVMSLLFRRVLLRVRGLRFRERGADEIPRDRLVRIDTCFSLGVGLGMVDPIRGSDFQTRYLLLSLEAGEPLRIAKGLALEAAFRAADGQGARATIDRLLTRAVALADKVSQPHARAITTLMKGISRVLLGDFPSGIPLCDRASTELRETCTGVAWELDNAAFFGGFSLLQCGRLDELRARMPAALDEASARGDLYAEVLLRMGCNWFLHLANDDIRRAELDLGVITEEWSRNRFLLQHGWKLINEVEIALYRGYGESPVAWQHIEETWPRLEGSLLLRAEALRIRTFNARARAALGAASISNDDPALRESFLRIAERTAKGMKRETWPTARGFRLLLEAGVAAARDQRDVAADRLRSAIRELEATDSRLHVAVARLTLGHYVGGDEGASLIAAGKQAMNAVGVVKPARMAGIFLPGRWWGRPEPMPSSQWRPPPVSLAK